jgi:hypothetical protein
MRPQLQPVTVPTRHRATPNGASDSSISPTRMVTNLASLGRCNAKLAMTKVRRIDYMPVKSGHQQDGWRCPLSANV